MQPVSLPRMSVLSVRGLACILLVAYHVVGSSGDNGLRLPMSSAWHYATASFEFLRMPLFSVLSGYLYAGRRPTRETIGAFARGKVRRILMPLLFATLVTVWLRATVYGPDVTPLHALTHHYQHFWFLQALLLIFAGIALWDVVRPARSSDLLIVAFLAVMIDRSVLVTDVFSLNGAVYLLPFFAFGMMLKMEPTLLERQDFRKVSLAVVAGVLLAQQSGLLFGTVPVLRNSLPAAMAGCAASALFLIYLPRSAFLEVIGRYSYTIYIWHSIAGAAMRTAVGRMAAVPVPVMFVIVLIGAILIPMAVHIVVRSLPALSTLAAGVKREPVRRRQKTVDQAEPPAAPYHDEQRFA